MKISALTTVITIECVSVTGFYEGTIVSARQQDKIFFFFFRAFAFLLKVGRVIESDVLQTESHAVTRNRVHTVLLHLKGRYGICMRLFLPYEQKIIQLEIL